MSQPDEFAPANRAAFATKLRHCPSCDEVREIDRNHSDDCPACLTRMEEAVE